VLEGRLVTAIAICGARLRARRQWDGSAWCANGATLCARRAEPGVQAQVKAWRPTPSDAACAQALFTGMAEGNAVVAPDSWTSAISAGSVLTCTRLPLRLAQRS
jgi:hypothetical protein